MVPVMSSGFWQKQKKGLIVSSSLSPPGTLDGHGAPVLQRTMAMPTNPMNTSSDKSALAVTSDDPVGETARQLIAELCTEMSHRYGTPPSPFSLSEAWVPGSIFLVARISGQPVGCGALRPLEGDVAEIKRMYVAPAARRRGVARRILAELERHAGDLGYRALRLETGILQPEAQQLYAAMGFRRIPAFAHYIGNPTSMCFEKLIPNT